MLSDGESVSQEEDGESDQSGSNDDKISDGQSDFTNSSGSSRSPMPKYNRKRSAGKANLKSSSKTKSRCVDRYLKQESS